MLEDASISISSLSIVASPCFFFFLAEALMMISSNILNNPGTKVTSRSNFFLFHHTKWTLVALLNSLIQCKGQEKVKYAPTEFSSESTPLPFFFIFINLRGKFILSRIFLITWLFSQCQPSPFFCSRFISKFLTESSFYHEALNLDYHCHYSYLTLLTSCDLTERNSCIILYGRCWNHTLPC